MASYVTSVSFRLGEDADLLTFLKKRSGTPEQDGISGVSIRDLLYAYMATERGGNE